MTAPLPYLQRIREYYQALGYGEPYRFAQLDEVAFYLAEQGYTGKVNQVKTVIVMETTYYSKRSKRLVRIVLLCTILLVLLSGWFVVYRKQSQGNLLCDTLHVQFSTSSQMMSGNY